MKPGRPATLRLPQPDSRPVAAKQFNPGIFARASVHFPFAFPDSDDLRLRSGPWRYATDRQQDERSAARRRGRMPQQSSDDFQIKTTGTRRDAYVCRYHTSGLSRARQIGKRSASAMERQQGHHRDGRYAPGAAPITLLPARRTRIKPAYAAAEHWLGCTGSRRCGDRDVSAAWLR
jgi:hypothetical protein